MNIGAIIPLAALLLATLSGCSRSATQQEMPNTSNTVISGRKCPDPDIRDSKNPCSPLYWNPKDSSLRNSEKF
jgi:hypothetical protein